jgi:hypothetical protein
MMGAAHRSFVRPHPAQASARCRAHLFYLQRRQPICKVSDRLILLSQASPERTRFTVSKWPLQHRNHREYSPYFPLGFPVSKALWRLSFSLPSREPRPAMTHKERRRPKTASIFTRFSLMRVRVHLGAPRGCVQIKHAWRRKKSLLGRQHY